MYGVTPIIGRGITEADTGVGAPPVMLLGYNYWQSRFAGKKDVLGQTMRFNDGQATIVGVLPASFKRSSPIWRPLQATALERSMRGTGTSTYGRLRVGLSVDQAQRELTWVLAHAPGARPGQAVTLHSLLAKARAGSQTTVNILAGAVGLILLIACVNVSGPHPLACRRLGGRPCVVVVTRRARRHHSHLDVIRRAGRDQPAGARLQRRALRRHQRAVWPRASGASLARWRGTRTRARRAARRLATVQTWR